MTVLVKPSKKNLNKKFVINAERWHCIMINDKGGFAFIKVVIIKYAGVNLI